MAKKRRNSPSLAVKIKHLTDNGSLHVQAMGVYPNRRYRIVLENRKGKQLEDGMGSTFEAAINHLYDNVFE